MLNKEKDFVKHLGRRPDRVVYEQDGKGYDNGGNYLGKFKDNKLTPVKGDDPAPQPPVVDDTKSNNTEISETEGGADQEGVVDSSAGDDSEGSVNEGIDLESLADEELIALGKGKYKLRLPKNTKRETAIAKIREVMEAQ